MTAGGKGKALVSKGSVSNSEMDVPLDGYPQMPPVSVQGRDRTRYEARKTRSMISPIPCQYLVLLRTGGTLERDPPPPNF